MLDEKCFRWWPLGLHNETRDATAFVALTKRARTMFALHSLGKTWGILRVMYSSLHNNSHRVVTTQAALGYNRRLVVLTRIQTGL